MIESFSRRVRFNVSKCQLINWEEMLPPLKVQAPYPVLTGSQYNRILHHCGVSKRTGTIFKSIKHKIRRGCRELVLRLYLAKLWTSTEVQCPKHEKLDKTNEKMMENN